jgi:rhamnogalacturonan endolyase
MEALDRGAVAVPAKGGGNLVSWRLLAPDAPTTEFDVYRDGRKINARSLSGGTNIVDKAGTPQSTYVIRTRVRGKDIEISKPVGAWAEGYLSIPIPPYPSFYLGDGTKIPRVPNIVARKSSKGGAK